MENNIMSHSDRDDDARDIRKDAAQLAKERKGSDHPRNGEENDYDGKFIANYSKGLRHFPITDASKEGEVDPNEYTHLKEGNFDKINFVHPMNQAVKLTNPRSGRAFDLEGPDSHDMGIRAPPRIDSAEGAGEMAELYWMALCRDIPFRNYDTDTMIANAVSDLNSNTNYSDFPHVQVGVLTDTDIGDDIGDKIFAKKFNIIPEARNISNDTIFRGFTKGDLKGPYLSQFLWKDIPLGTLLIEQIQFELNMYSIGISGMPNGRDHLTDYARWLKIQDGFKDEKQPPDADNFMADDINKKLKRHIISGRDITYYVHRDQLYQAYLNACLILLGKDYPFTTDCPFDPLLPYQDQNPNEFHNELGFITFGGPHILSLVAEVATRAGKAIWYQKWFQHRRLRPEAFGGLIHRQLNNKTGSTSITELTPGLSPSSYQINNEILNKLDPPATPPPPKQILSIIKEHNKLQNNHFGRTDIHGSYLLPQAFPEGSPTHPSYGSGHATVAGACVTVLKAFFDEDAEILHPVIPKQIVPPNTRRKVVDGNNNIVFEISTELEPYTSPPGEELKVGEELNKLATNISIGRNWSGVHYRSDYTEAVMLGEQIALGILQEQATTYKRSEKFACTLTRFSGEKIQFDGREIKKIS
jgi:membrane-associated phospholipid phosphatase